MAARKTVFVGIDVAKDQLDVHIRPLGSGFIVSNNAAGYAGLIARLTVAALADRARARLSRLRTELQEIDAAMRTIVASDRAKQALFDCLTALKGVGPVLAYTLIANMRELGTLSRRRVAALIGVAPMNDDSGKRRGSRAICGGRGGCATCCMSRP